MTLLSSHRTSDAEGIRHDPNGRLQGVDGRRRVPPGALPSMTDDRKQRLSLHRSGGTDPGLATLPSTADETRGSSNLATTPYAGNVSSDTRAGRSG